MDIKILSYLLIFSVTWIKCRRIRHENRDLLQQEFNLRVQQLSNWTCDTPKPKLIYLDDSSNDNGYVAEPNIGWIPLVAVLHRCDQSTGCCSNHFSCKPIETERVSLVFRRLDMLRGTDSFQRFEFTNHTQCSCLSNHTRAEEL